MARADRRANAALGYAADEQAITGLIFVAAYAAGATAGGFLFLRAAARLASDPSRKSAMGSFHASLAQLSLLLLGVILDAALRG